MMPSVYSFATLALMGLATVTAAPAMPSVLNSARSIQVMDGALVDQFLNVNATSDVSKLAQTIQVLDRATANQPLTVNTTSGVFNGDFNADTGVYRYLGIPYAETTALQNRFKPPIPKAYSPSARSAKSFGPSCPQFVRPQDAISLKLNGQDVGSLQQDEDCLSVNAWVGKDVRENALSGKAKAPILVWVHGGGFITGSSSLPIYSLEKFVSRHPDVIAISINYRVNIFGFPSAPQLINTPGGTNLGLLDRDLAFDWIYRNAAAFGGDAEAITLEGQSAGGAAVDAWTYSHSGQDGLPSTKGTGVRGFIIQSGLAQGLDILLTPPVLPPPSSSQSAWNIIAGEVGCGTTSDDAQLNCMRKPSWQTIKKALDAKQPTLGPNADGKTWFKDFKSRSTFGKFARLPTLMGHDETEATILVAKSLDVVPSGLGSAPPITNVAFRCAASDNEKARSSNSVPVWRYLYSGNWDDVNCGRPALGAYHSSEIGLVFSNYGPTRQCDATVSSAPGPARLGLTPEEDQTSAFLSNSWATFVRDPSSGLDKSGWPRYKSQFDKTVAHISANNTGKVDYLMPFGLGGDCIISGDVTGLVANLAKQIGLL